MNDPPFIIECAKRLEVGGYDKDTSVLYELARNSSHAQDHLVIHRFSQGVDIYLTCPTVISQA